MITRNLFKWDVQIADETGQIHKVVLENYWSPEKEAITPEFVAMTAAAEVSAKTKKKYFPVLAELVQP